jgi:peptidoglycan/LPS O-acetylase OafA/YrhL
MPDNRLCMLDGLRGVAAMSVILVHYYFFAAADSVSTQGISWLPARELLSPFYEHGFRAVQVFWVISGYIFTRIYCFGSQASTREFAVNRFARLYPLHFVTLLAMAGLQFITFETYGRYLFNPNNDAYHFGLHVLMITGWGLQKGASYNDVIWSVSAELAIYALFWVLRGWLIERRAAGALAVAALCGAVVLTGPPNFIFACGFFYFFGSMLAFVSADLSRSWRYADAVTIPSLAALGVAAMASRHPIIAPSVGFAACSGALVLLSVRAEPMFGQRFRAAAQWLGDCSYGIYLWHMPLQLALILTLSRFTSVSQLAAQGWFMALYLLAVISLARISYIVLERPARDRLRRLAMPNGGKVPKPAVTKESDMPVSII